MMCEFETNTRNVGDWLWVCVNGRVKFVDYVDNDDVVVEMHRLMNPEWRDERREELDLD